MGYFLFSFQSLINDIPGHARNKYNDLLYSFVAYCVFMVVYAYNSPSKFCNMCVRARACVRVRACMWMFGSKRSGLVMARWDTKLFRFN